MVTQLNLGTWWQQRCQFDCYCKTSAGTAACRCLVVCKSLGIFATAHADGKLYLRPLPDLEAGGGPIATIGEQPVQTLSDGTAAIIQA